MKFLFFAISVLLLGSFSNAASGDWSERGNGGDVVVCASGTHTMLDLYETHNRYNFETFMRNIPAVGFPFKVGPEELVEVAIEKITDNLNHVDPRLKAQLVFLAQDFNSETWFLSDEYLGEIDDSGHVAITDDCVLKQLIIRRFAPDKSTVYAVSNDLWKNMGFQSRMAAILHEIIYRMALQLNPNIKDSEKIRYFNALILSDRLKDFSQADYEKLYQKVFEVPKQ